MKRKAMPILQEIAPCLWFDDQAEEAVRFYLSIFTDSKIESIARYTKAGFEIHGRPDGSVMTVDFHLAGQNFTALNGGPLFKFTPAISFFVVCESEAEVDALWKALAHRGEVLMDLAKYDWSEKYGWLNDRYGLSWQIALGKFADVGQKITPSLMFVGAQNGRAEEALKYYASIFEGSGIDGILRYGPGEADSEGNVKHAQFHLGAQKFMAMDSALDHPFTFEAISFQVLCETQDEVDYYWERLSQGGDPAARQCGWLKDKFGVSWQVVPTVLTEMLRDSNVRKAERVTKAFLQMKKFDIAKLKHAYEEG